jgi:hypothetical protein
VGVHLLVGVWEIFGRVAGYSQLSHQGLSSVTYHELPTDSA